MSWEHEWPLTVWPTRREVERAIAELLAVARVDNPVVSHEAWDDLEIDDEAAPNGWPDGDELPPGTTITLVFRVPVATAVDVALRLDPLADRASYQQGLEPPRGDIDWEAAQRDGHVTVDGPTRSISLEGEALFTTRPDHYELAVDLVAPDDDDDRQAHVRVYSNMYDNREAYGIAAVIATDLADRLEKLSAFS